MMVSHDFSGQCLTSSISVQLKEMEIELFANVLKSHFFHVTLSRSHKRNVTKTLLPKLL